MNQKNLKKNRWSTYHFKNGLCAKNRIVVPPMASGKSTLEGNITLQMLDHYKKLAESGAGIIFVEYTYIHSSGRSEEHQLGLQSDQHISGHKELVKNIKASGSLVGIQLVHSGGKSSLMLTGGKLLGASPIIVPTKENNLECPSEISLSEVEDYQSWFVQAAIRADLAGYDIIELHSAHGYGLNQWLSPITNHRNDCYGGELKNRSKMLLEIFNKIRRTLPHKVLGVRLPGGDLFGGGLELIDMIFVAKELEKLGADFLDISSGIGGWRRPIDRKGEGYLLPEAIEIQKNVRIPIIGVGGIESGDFIDKTIQNRLVGFTAIGRKILSDPILFFNEVLDQ